MSDKTMFFRLILVFSYFCFVFGNDFENNDRPIVKTSSGTVEGLTINVLNRKINQFLGIPYAEPPVESLRFAKPKPISKPIEVSIELNSFQIIITRFALKGYNRCDKR